MHLLRKGLNPTTNSLPDLSQFFPCGRPQIVMVSTMPPLENWLDVREDAYSIPFTLGYPHRGTGFSVARVVGPQRVADFVQVDPLVVRIIDGTGVAFQHSPQDGHSLAAISGINIISRWLPRPMKPIAFFFLTSAQ